LHGFCIFLFVCVCLFLFTKESFVQDGTPTPTVLLLVRLVGDKVFPVFPKDVEGSGCHVRLVARILILSVGVGNGPEFATGPDDCCRRTTRMLGGGGGHEDDGKGRLLIELCEIGSSLCELGLFVGTKFGCAVVVFVVAMTTALVVVVVVVAIVVVKVKNRRLLVVFVVVAIVVRVGFLLIVMVVVSTALPCRPCQDGMRVLITMVVLIIQSDGPSRVTRKQG
jgi:hypothetical protein